MADIENLRYEAGKDARVKGEPLHDSASPEFAKGYNKGSGIGSNVMPKHFGKGVVTKEPWVCVCGFENKYYMIRKSEGQVVCWKCKTPRAYGEDKSE